MNPKPRTDYIRQASSGKTYHQEVVEDIYRQLGDGEYSLLLIFFAPAYGESYPDLFSSLSEKWPNSLLVGCSTAGEIGQGGYLHDHLVVAAFLTEYFWARQLIIDRLDTIELDVLATQLAPISDLKSSMAIDTHDKPYELALLLCDGMSRQEDKLVALLGEYLGQTPLIGGSAGDGTEFSRPLIYCQGELRDNAACLILIRSACPIQLFCRDHIEPTNQRMVVTKADLNERVVYEINGEPAAKEYARLVGKDAASLSSFTFAANPLTVMVGNKRHVRAIQSIAEDGSLRFFSAIDEGLVLTIARTGNLANHLSQLMQELNQPEVSVGILAFDCILRRIQTEQEQIVHIMSRILAKHNVFGFNTYGEQFNQLHINQTITGVAFYAPSTLHYS